MRIILLLLSMMLFYFLTGNTWYVRDNAYSMYLKEFKGFFGASLGTIILDALCIVITVLHLVRNGDDDLLLSMRGYQAANLMCQLAYAGQFACAAWASGQALQPHHWQQYVA